MSAFGHLISADDHVTIGNSIKTAQDEILTVTRFSPLESCIHQEAVAAMASLERLRLSLDNLLFHQVQNRPDPRLLCHRVYDSHTQLQIRRPLPNKTEFGPDVFAAWEVSR